MMRAVKTWSTPVIQEEQTLVPCALCGGLRFRPALRCDGFAYVRCPRCGLLQMNPQPRPEAIRRRYGADYLAYEKDRETAFLDLQLRALTDAGFWEFEEALSSRPGAEVGAVKRVLDVGCATGSLLARLQYRGWEAWGVEISQPQADYARRERGLAVSSLPLEENQYPPASFEAILASHLIEHLNDPRGLVREARRLLAPGGVFIVTTPNAAGFQARLFGPRWRSAIFDHLYLFSRRTLTRLLREEGFTVTRAVTWGGLAAGTAPLPLKRLADALAKRLGLGDVMALRCEAL